MAFIEIKNKKGTGSKTPPSSYSSWLDFWENKKGRTAIGCQVLTCKGSADLGGHVIKSGEGGKEYILPMCTSCNNKPDGEIFKAWENDLVSVN